MKIIYDVGANNGDDIQYYLLKSDLVVAIEANPDLCDVIRLRFEQEISDGRIIVLNCIVTDQDLDESQPFYVHKRNHVLSQFPRPANPEDYSEILVSCNSISSVIRRYGPPHYVKIDIEHYDAVILRSLFANSIYPDYLSAESHTIEIFSLLSSCGAYGSFKMVDGASVSSRYLNASIQTKYGAAKYSFPFHSAGPFGNDIEGPWMTADNFFKVLAFANLGWKDIHVSKNDLSDPSYKPSLGIKIEQQF